MKFMIEERWRTLTSERVGSKWSNEEGFSHC